MSAKTSSKNLLPKKHSRESINATKEQVKCSRCRKLEQENSQLLKELSEQKACFTHLIQETTSESYDARRVNLLKAQILHLERQILLLNQTILGYTELRHQVNILKDTAIKKIHCLKEQMPTEPVLHQLDSIKDDILKLKDKQRVVQPCSRVYTGRYASSKECELSLLDTIIEGQDIADINNISWLEDQIHQLYNYLVKLEGSLRVIPTVTTPTLSSLDPAYANVERLHSLSKTSLDQCRLVAQELLTLSLQFPLQSQRKIKKICHIDVKQLINELAPFLKSRQQVKDILIKLIGSANGIYERLNERNEVLESELDHHRALYTDHLIYMEDVFKAIRSGHKTFIDSLNESVLIPLQHIIASYGDGSKMDDCLESLRVNIPTLTIAMERVQEIMSSSAITEDLFNQCSLKTE